MNKIILLLLGLVLLSACVKEPLFYPSTEKETVDVTLKIKIGNKTNAATKADAGDPGRAFNVLFAEEPEAETRSDGTTPLHHLWVFQFASDGSIVGAPRHVSSTDEPVYDMTSLQVKLVPGTDQTIYLVVLGEVFGETVDFDAVRSLSALEKFDFMGLKFVNGAYFPLIENDRHIPYAGKVTGVTIKEVSGKTEGEITFTHPEGFIGGVEIKRLMAKVVFKYQYNVDEYEAVGASLSNVPDRISIAPSGYMAGQSAKVVELASQKRGDKTGDYYTHTWYVPQNRQGTVDVCTTEGSRYPGNQSVPAKASLIRLFANHRTEGVKYLKYSIYVGKNNTSNFDIEANWQYNLVTDLVLAEEAAVKDRRVEGFELKAGSRLVANQVGRIVHASIGLPDGVIVPKDGEVEMVGDDYNFDCHYDQRPLYVQAAGRNVLVDVTEGDWLKVYSYANFTEAEKAGANFRQAKGVLIVPSELTFMVACDENLTPAAREGKIQVTTISEDGSASVVVEYLLKQNPGYDVGRIGGDIVPLTGGYGYSHGLLYESVLEYTKKYDQATVSTITDGVYWGYKGAIPPIPDGYYNGMVNDWASIYKVKDGKALTKILAENTTRIPINGGGQIPVEQPDGNLYQYTYYNAFAARICYDKNRDLNGNGVIDYLPGNESGNELRWYLPTLNQLQGAYVFSNDEAPFRNFHFTSDLPIPSIPYSLSALKDTALYIDFDYGFIRLDWRNKESGVAYHVRCVRDIPRVNHNRSIYKEEGYVVIDATEAMPARGVTNRMSTDFYQQVLLYAYMADSTSAKVPIERHGVHQEGKRILRHHQRGNGWQTTSANAATEVAGSHPNRLVSSRFAIAPVNLNASVWGGGNVEKLSWDVAAGYLLTVQSAAYNIGIYGTERGCAMYGGLSGSEQGQWRLPTYRELSLISMYVPVLVKEGYYPDGNFNDNKFYFSATELYVTQPAFVVERSNVINLTSKTMGNVLKKDTYYARCIKDLP